MHMENQFDNARKRLAPYSDRLVPPFGPADTRAGEVVRALEKITYRYLNAGDRIGVGYGNETCNGPARFLVDAFPGDTPTEQALLAQMNGMWGEGAWKSNAPTEDEQDRIYEGQLAGLIDATLDWLDTTDLENVPNTGDMTSGEWKKPEDRDYLKDDRYQDDEEYNLDDEDLDWEDGDEMEM